MEEIKLTKDASPA